MSDIALIIIVLATILISFILGIGLFVLKIMMIIDVINRPLNKKVKWIVINSVVPFGYVFYYFMIKRPNIIEGKKVKEYATLAMVSVVCGIVGSFLFVWLGILLGITSIICGVIHKSKKTKPEDDKLAKAGIILGSISAGFQILFVIAYFAFFFIIVLSGFAAQAAVDHTEPQLRDTLKIGDYKTYHYNGEDIEVRIVTVDHSLTKADISINGDSPITLKERQTYEINDNNSIYISDIIDLGGTAHTSFIIGKNEMLPEKEVDPNWAEAQSLCDEYCTEFPGTEGMRVSLNKEGELKFTCECTDAVGDVFMEKQIDFVGVY